MLYHTFCVRGALRHFRSAPFRTATRLLHNSDDSPSSYDPAPIDYKLNMLQSEMRDIRDMSKSTVDKIKCLGDKLAMEIKVLGTTIDARFEMSDAKSQLKFDGLRIEIQSKFDGLRIELKDREARFWARVVFTVLAVAGVTSSAAFLQY